MAHASKRKLTQSGALKSLGLKVQYVMCDLNELKVAHPEKGGYQRFLCQSDVDSIAENFSVVRCREPYISKRKNGSLYIVDGQHTVAGAIKAGLSHLRCKVIEGLSYKDEANLFHVLHEQTKQLKPFEVFRAEFQAGNKVAKDIVEVLGERGYLLYGVDTLTAVGCNEHGQVYVGCIKTLKRMYEKGGRSAIGQVFSEIDNIWGSDPHSVKSHLVEGLYHFLKVFGDDVNLKRLRSRLGAVQPLKLFREGVNLSDILHYTRYKGVTRRMAEIYNTRLQKGRLDLEKI